MKISLQNTEKPFQAFDLTLTIESEKETSHIIDLFMKDGSVAYRDIARQVMNFSSLDDVKKTELLLEMEGSTPQDHHPEIYAAMKANAENVVCNFGNSVTLSDGDIPNYNPDYAVESDYSGDVQITDTIEQDHEKFQDLTETVREIQKDVSKNQSPNVIKSSTDEVVALRNELFGKEDIPFDFRIDQVITCIVDLFYATHGTEHHLTHSEIFSLVDNLGSQVSLDVHDKENSERVTVALRIELARHLGVSDIINTLINNHYVSPPVDVPLDNEFPSPPNIPDRALIDQVMDQMSRIDVQSETPSIQSALQASKEKLEQNLVKPEPCIGDDCPDGEGVMFR